MTKREFLETVKTMMSDMADFEPYATNPLRDIVFAFAESEIEKMDARNAKRSSTPSKKSIENEPIKESIVNLLANEDGGKTASEITAEIGFSTQKISAICRQMVEDGRLVSEDIKVKGKGKQKSYRLA